MKHRAKPKISQFEVNKNILLKDKISEIENRSLEDFLPVQPSKEEILATMADDVKALYGTEPKTIGGLPDCTQPVCNPDPRMTIQVNVANKETNVAEIPWRLSNSWKGYLIMSPGGKGGKVGELLYQIDQYYSHMGIVTKELPVGLGAYEIRHPTGMEDRMRDFPHRNGDDLIPNAPLHYHGQKNPLTNPTENVPTDGFQEQAVRYGWPGTITQTVGDLIGKSSFKDIVSGQEYDIHELTLDSKFVNVKKHGHSPDGENVIVDAICVRPPNGMESPQVLNALHRITEEAKNLNCHYRFFCYTKGDIGMDRNFDGALMTEENSSTKDPTCQNKNISVSKTAAAVCSSFIWTCTQLANQKATGTSMPQIILDGRPKYKYDTSLVGSEFFKREISNCQIPPPNEHIPIDGLYFYSEPLRKKLAEWFYNKLHDEVVKEILDDTNIEAWLKEHTTLAGINIYKVLNTFSLGTAQLILGLSNEALAEVVRLFSDLPSDIANQITNSFANDDCSVNAKDSDAWTNPGIGMAISPDDVINGWTYPTIPRFETEQKLNPNLPNILLGVYGWNKKIDPCPPIPLPNVPKFIWEISLGECTIGGGVKYSNKHYTEANKGVPGVRVYIGCKLITSDEKGLFKEIKIPSGTYWVRAVYDDPVTGLLWQSVPFVKDFPLNENTSLDIVLEPPAEINREIIIRAHWDIVNEHVIGQWEGSYDDNPKPHYLGEGLKNLNAQDSFPLHPIDDWGDTQMNYQLDLNPKDLKVTVHCQTRMENHADDEWVSFQFDVSPKKINNESPFLFEITLTRDAGFYPITGKLKIYIDNNILAGGLP
ncbi:MAG: hypothetical protein IT249_08620 [Chitinophagaceae bacterium]|nr:hypothetical protein [Chitinophagaceae bacterium]